MFGRPRIYLDYASAVPVLPRAKAAFTAALAAYGNPSAPHAEGRSARTIVEDARTAVARLAEVKPDAVLFTSGATEANALAIQGVVRASKHENPHVLYLPTAHSSVVETMEALAQEGAAKGITVNAICPGYIGTEMVRAIPEKVLNERIIPQIPVGRLGEPDEIARCVVFLASDDAGFITGSTISANGGQFFV